MSDLRIFYTALFNVYTTCTVYSKYWGEYCHLVIKKRLGVVRDKFRIIQNKPRCQGFPYRVSTASLRQD